MQRHTNSDAFPTLKWLCDIYIYRIKFRMLEMRENEVALREVSGGTAQLRTLEGTLLAFHVVGAFFTAFFPFKHCLCT